MERQFTGTVIRTTGSWYDVRTNAGETVKCRIRGRLRLKGVRSTNPVVVGDRVVCERDEEDAGVICEICLLPTSFVSKNRTRYETTAVTARLRKSSPSIG